MSLKTESEKNQIIEELMDQYGLMVKKLAYSMVKSLEAADDLTQEIFLACYLNIDNYRGDSSYKTWIYKITLNKCKDYLRSSYYKRIFLSNNIESISNKTPEDILIVQHDTDYLIKIIMNLPFKYRSLIIMYYFENLDIRTISEITEINPGTIKTRLKRARNKIKSKITKEGVLNCLKI